MRTVLMALIVGAALLVPACGGDDAVSEPVAIEPDGIVRLERLMNAGELPTSAGLSVDRLAGLLEGVGCGLDRNTEAMLGRLDGAFVHAEVAKIVALCPLVDPDGLSDVAPGIDEDDIERMLEIAGAG